MVQAQPALPSILQRHWDRWQRSGTPLTIVLSGSALTLMEELLAHSSPLFGRADYRPLIQPLDYRFAAEFARAGAPADALLRRYAVLGGTPQYQVWAGKGGISSVIRDRVLSKGESLYEEPLHLLREEQTIRDPATYFAVLRASRGGATKFNEIQQQAQNPAEPRTHARAAGRARLRREAGGGRDHVEAPAQHLPHRRSALPLLVSLRLPESQPARAGTHRRGARRDRGGPRHLHGPGVRGLLPRLDRTLRADRKVPQLGSRRVLVVA